MPTVFWKGPYRFFFVSIDCPEPPHIHVKRERKTAKFWLDPLSIERDGGFSRTELNTIARLVAENQAELLERWYEFCGT